MSEASERGQRYRDRAKEVLIADDTLRYMRSFGGKLAIAADRTEEMQAKLDRYRTALERLARLGNGDRYGNSEGNCIAQQALNGEGK